MSKFKLPWTTSGHDDGPTSTLGPLLARDMALMFSQIGIMSLRASVVDMESMAFHPAWSISDRGEVAEDPMSRGLDSAFPAAMATIAQMGVSSPEHTVVRKLSPRHWAFAWRIDDHHVAVAEARYRDQRDMQTEADTALVRLICDNGIRAGQADGAAGMGRHAQLGSGDPADAPQLQWPGKDRRQRGGLAGISPLHLVLVLVSAMLALWLAAVAIPWARSDAVALQAELTRMHDMSNGSMTQILATTLATGDYGEVQAALSSFATLGYFQGAAVTNARQRIISMSGAVKDARMGDPVPAALLASASVVDLSIGTERYGQLLTWGTSPPASSNQGFLVLLVSAVLVCLSTAVAAVLLMRRQRRRTDPAA